MRNPELAKAVCLVAWVASVAFGAWCVRSLATGRGEPAPSRVRGAAAALLASVLLGQFAVGLWGQTLSFTLLHERNPYQAFSGPLPLFAGLWSGMLARWRCPYLPSPVRLLLLFAAASAGMSLCSLLLRPLLDVSRPSSPDVLLNACCLAALGALTAGSWLTGRLVPRASAPGTATAEAEAAAERAALSRYLTGLALFVPLAWLIGEAYVAGWFEARGFSRHQVGWLLRDGATFLFVPCCLWALSAYERVRGCRSLRPCSPPLEEVP